MTKSSATKPRLPQRRRAAPKQLPPFRLTRRDGEILHSLYAYRALTTEQVSDLHFAPVALIPPPPPGSRCLHRLKLLFHHHFVARTEQPHVLAQGRKPFVVHLDQAGALWLAQQEACEVAQLDWKPGEAVSPLFLDHLLITNDVRIAIVRAARRHAYTIPQWLDARTLKQAQNKDTVVLTGATGRKQNAAVVPDGYFVLHTGTHYYHQFLEVDRATTTGISGEWGRRTWARKIVAFIEYYRSGKYHARYHTKSMRVLTITTGEKRLANLRAITEESGGKARFWFATLHDVLTQDVLLDPIWQVAGSDERKSLVW